MFGLFELGRVRGRGRGCVCVCGRVLVCVCVLVCACVGWGVGVSIRMYSDDGPAHASQGPKAFGQQAKATAETGTNLWSLAASSFNRR